MSNCAILLRFEIAILRVGHLSTDQWPQLVEFQHISSLGVIDPLQSAIAIRDPPTMITNNPIRWGRVFHAKGLGVEELVPSLEAQRKQTFSPGCIGSLTGMSWTPGPWGVQKVCARSCHVCLFVFCACACVCVCVKSWRIGFPADGANRHPHRGAALRPRPPRGARESTLKLCVATSFACARRTFGHMERFSTVRPCGLLRPAFYPCPVFCFKRAGIAPACARAAWPRTGGWTRVLYSCPGSDHVTSGRTPRQSVCVCVCARSLSLSLSYGFSSQSAVYRSDITCGGINH